RLIAIGIGEEKDANAETLRAAAGRASKALARAKAKRAALAVPALRRVKPEQAGQALAEGLLLGSYRFEKYKSGTEKAPTLEAVA
ncbi:M17 family peptidase N-terminal domain-containing protein, partial [Enterococcus casseliflavus]|uniref:M17 family peptidase N-terminal domain-containing protein n=1 Tax=Enterococcus casseliflavus TaxID=37734 RepID=UPI003D0E990A